MLCAVQAKQLPSQLQLLPGGVQAGPRPQQRLLARLGPGSGGPQCPQLPFPCTPPSCSDVDSKDKSRSHGSAELLGGREVWQECCLGRREGGTEIIYFPGNGFAPRRVKPRHQARLWTTQACRAARDPAPRWRLGCSRTPDGSPRGAG